MEEKKYKDTWSENSNVMSSFETLTNDLLNSEDNETISNPIGRRSQM